MWISNFYVRKRKRLWRSSNRSWRPSYSVTWVEFVIKRGSDTRDWNLHCWAKCNQLNKPFPNSTSEPNRLTKTTPIETQPIIQQEICGATLETSLNLPLKLTIQYTELYPQFSWIASTHFNQPHPSTDKIQNVAVVIKWWYNVKRLLLSKCVKRAWTGELKRRHPSQSFHNRCVAEGTE